MQMENRTTTVMTFSPKKQNPTLKKNHLHLKNQTSPQMIMKKENLLNKEQLKDLKKIKIKEKQKVKLEPKGVN